MTCGTGIGSGGANLPDVIIAPAATIIERLAENIELSHLAQSLRDRIAVITNLEAGLTQINTLVATETSVLAQELLALRNDVTGAVGYINEQTTIQADERQALVTSLNTLVAGFGTNIAALEESSTVLAEKTGALLAEKTVKADLAGNVTGYGLSAYLDPLGNFTSDFRVAADKFSIAPPAYVSNTPPPANQLHDGKVWVDTSGVGDPIIKWYNASNSTWQLTPVKAAQPFVYLSTPTTLDDGTILPPGLYVNTAVIGQITADQIDTRGLTVRDLNGNVLLSSEVPVDFETHVGGSTKPAPNATNSNVYRQTTAPSGGVYTTNDLWIDTDSTPTLISQWDGSNWVAVGNYTTNTTQLTDGANLGGTAVWSGVSGTGKPADGATKNVIYRQATAPTGGTYTEGDLWYDTDATVPTLYNWNGSDWAVVSNSVTNTNQIADGAGLGTTSTWAGVSGAGKPADNATAGSNLVKKAVFTDNSPGGWPATVGVGGPDGKELQVSTRDTYEAQNTFAVKPGEIFYINFEGWTALSSYSLNVGLNFLDVNGGVVNWLAPTGVAPGQGWTEVLGKITVPANATQARPWIQIDGPGGTTLPYCAVTRIYIGRVQPGANATTVENGLLQGVTQGAGTAVDNSLVSTITLSTTNGYSPGNSFVKNSGAGSDWNAQAYTPYGYAGGCYATFRCPNAASVAAMAGLNRDPLADASYFSLDFAAYFSYGTLEIYESGVYKGSFGAVSGLDVITIAYDGTTVKYMRNGAVVRTVIAAISEPLYFDSSINTPGASLNNIEFGPLNGGAVYTPANLLTKPDSYEASNGWNTEASSTSVIVDSGLPNRNGQLKATKIRFTAGPAWDKYRQISGLPAGTYRVNVWYFLDTASNFVLTVNDTSGWNTGESVVGTASGLWALVSAKITTNTGSINIHIGAHQNTGTQQTTGNVILADMEVINVSSSENALLVPSITAAATTATWSGVSGPGRPADNATADLFLIGSGVSISGNNVKKTAASGWNNSTVYSKEGYVGGAAATIYVTGWFQYMFGLDRNPTGVTDYPQLDYVMYPSGQTLHAYESGQYINLNTAHSWGDSLSVTYDGSKVRYFRNGVVLREVAANITEPLFFTAIPHETNAEISGIKFAPLSSNNWSAIGGANKPADNANNTYVQNGIIYGVSTGGGTVVDNTKVAGDTLLPDPQFLSSAAWVGGFDGTDSATFASINATRWVGDYANSPGVALNLKAVSGDQRYGGTRILVEAGATYRLKLRVFRSTDVAGTVWVGIHVPGQRWACPFPGSEGSPDAGFNLSSFTADQWTNYEMQFVVGTGWSSHVQTYIRNNLTAGDFWFTVEFSRVVNWSNQITGSGKPEDNATVGATAGANLKDSSGNIILTDSIKNNLAYLDWWKRDASIPWSVNAEYNRIIQVPTDLNVPGPKGGDDFVWYCQEVSNDGQQGGGWNGGTHAALDTSKTYRFVIPIRKGEGYGQAYWGTQNVCNLNTTNVNDNPYFASINTDGLYNDRWYLFVGYLFPYGSTGNTSGSAGVWDCKTGQKVTGGSNWNFSTNQTPGFRAYKYYSSQGSTQLFGRPMINLVDGTEPSLREYFAPEALLNQSIFINGSGQLEGIGSGAGTAVANSLVEAQIGKGKWLVRKYDVARAAGTSPSYADIAGVSPSISVEVTERAAFDGQSIFGANYENYIGKATTYVYFSNAVTFSGNFSHDDGGRVYLNGTSVYSNGMAGSSSGSFTFAAGWNELELLWCEQGGGDGFTLPAAISSLSGYAQQFANLNTGTTLAQLNQAATTSTWSGTSSKPANLASLNGTETIQNSLITLSTNGTLNNAGGGQVTLPGMGYKTYRVTAYGNGATNRPVGAALILNGETISGGARSYVLHRILRSSGAVEFTQTYDVYGGGEIDGRTAATLAADLNATSNAYIVVVRTTDEPKNNRLSSGLDAAMYRCGASRAVFGSTEFKVHSAYILIGIPGCGEGNGAEFYQGLTDTHPDAWLDTSFSVVNGDLAGVAGSYTPSSLKDYGYTGSMTANDTYVSGGAIQGVSSGAGTVVANSSITVSGGTLTGIGTSGVQVDNSYQTIGQNLIPNSDQTQTKCFGGLYNPNGASLDFLNAYASTYWGVDSYTLSGASTRNLASRQISYVAGGNEAIAFDTYPLGGWGRDYGVPVVAGQRYMFSCYVASHRCMFHVGIGFWDAAGNAISSTNSGLAGPTESGANRLELYSRQWVALTAPAGAVTATVYVRKYNTMNSQGDSYIWYAAPQLEAVSANAQGPSPYVAGPPASVGQLGYTGALDANKTYVDGNGQIQGVSSGAGTNVSNGLIGLNASGQIYGIGAGSGTTVSNGQIYVDGSGNLNGIGSGAGTQVANSVLGVKTFSVPGDVNTFYPVAIMTTATGGATLYDFVIYRESVHLDGSWMGSYNCSIRARSSGWGSAAGIIEKVDQRTGSGNYTWGVAAVNPNWGGNQIWVWLRGGMQHTISMSQPIAAYTVTVYPSGYTDDYGTVSPRTDKPLEPYLNKSYRPDMAMDWGTAVTGNGKPADGANNTYIDSNGNIQGVSSGAGTSVSNALLQQLSLIPRGNCVVQGNQAYKNGGVNDWDSDVYSKDAYTGGAYVSFSPAQNSLSLMVGLNFDPTLDGSYYSLDYAFYCESTGNLYMWENGGNAGALGAYSAGEVLAIAYDGYKVKYFRNGAIVRTVSGLADNLSFYLDSSFASPGARVTNLQFGPLSNLGGKLDKQSSEILQIGNSTAMYFAGIRVGDIQWDGGGNRTSGKGLAITPQGLVGHNGTNTTFTLNATTGDLMARGDIEAQSLKANTVMVNTGNIASLAVDTLQIANQAVTIPVSAYTAASVAATSAAFTIQSVSLTSTGASIAIVGSASTNIGQSNTSSGGTVTGYLSIRRGATEIGRTIAKSYSSSGAFDFDDTFALNISDTPGVGAVTYNLVLVTTYSGGGFVVRSSSYRSLLALETKK